MGRLSGIGTRPTSRSIPPIVKAPRALVAVEDPPPDVLHGSLATCQLKHTDGILALGRAQAKDHCSCCLQLVMAIATSSSIL